MFHAGLGPHAEYVKNGFLVLFALHVYRCSTVLAAFLIQIWAICFPLT